MGRAILRALAVGWLIAVGMDLSERIALASSLGIYNPRIIWTLAALALPALLAIFLFRKRPGVSDYRGAQMLSAAVGFFVGMLVSQGAQLMVWGSTFD